MTRRDKCQRYGRRMRELTPDQRAIAWAMLASLLEDHLSIMDVPKFKDLLYAIGAATITAKK